METSFLIAPIFTDHMVLQQGTSNPVWGQAADGIAIRVEFLGQVYKTEAVNGKWRITLSPVNAGGSYEMYIKGGDHELIIRDILVGEVWVAGGQSNMQFILQDSLNGKEDIAQADNGNIRYYNVPRIASEEENPEQEALPEVGWQVCSPESAGQFSAVAYHFARKLSETLKVAVGIVGCNWGGTSASCWMSEDYLSSDDQIKVYLDEYYDHISKISEEEYNSQLDNYNKQTEEYSRKADAYKEQHPNADDLEMEEKVGVFPWPPPMGKTSFLRPSGLYHTMLQKIITYGIRGVIFYQGESDTHKSNLYGKLFSRMMQNWRDDWNYPTLPFIFTQLPYYGNGENSKENVETIGEEWAILREQQLMTSANDQWTGMAVITDCGERHNIHPLNKKPVGYRLALLAESKIYGIEQVYSGPVYREMKISGSTVTMYFDHTDRGLTAKNGELKGFKICGADRSFTAAKAVIKGNTVEVSADGIKAPVAVRYGFSNYIEANLFNGEGLPASPFRTDF